MEARWPTTTTIVVSVVALLATIDAFHCPIRECSCFYNGRETVKIACPPEHDGVRYTITHHVVEGELTVECLEPIVYGRAMFAKFQFANIVHVRFVRCPLPTDNVTFADVIDGVRPLVLDFNGNGGDEEGAVLDASLFANLGGLETLDLEGNRFAGVDAPAPSPDDGWRTLESLSLAENRLTAVPRSMLRLVPDLHGLSLAGNMLRYLEDDDFENLTSVQNLKLDRNRIESIGPRVFRALKTLKLLRLDDNRLRSMPAQLLHGLTHLQFLDLSGNDVERLPPQLLKDGIHLKVLKLRGNRRLTELPDDLLWSTTSLEELHLSDNNLTLIPDHLLGHTVRLLRLHLRSNRLSRLPVGAFANASRIAVLDLSANRLSSLDAHTFDGLVRLRELNLSHNSLKTIDADAFVSLVQLVRLDLAHNVLDEVPHPTAFEPLLRLRSLDLSYNFLAFVDDRSPPFGLPVNLASLNMSHNLLAAMDLRWIQSHRRLLSFNVSYNQIRYVVIGIGTGSHGILVVDLGHNLVNTVELSSSMSASELAVVGSNGSTDAMSKTEAMTAADDCCEGKLQVSLADNPLACDCHLLSLVNHVTAETNDSSSLTIIDAHGLVCTTPHELLDKPIEQVLPQQLYCPVTDDCGDGCTCIRLAVDGTVTMDCRQKSLTSIPLRSPANTTVLHVEGNNITSLGRLANAAWSDLIELYVSDNSLADFGDAPVTLPGNLRVIHVDNNRLRYLPEWFLVAVDSMRSSNETVLRLGNNPWVCDCRNVAFQRWLLENGDRVIDRADVVCKASRYATSPADRRGKKTYVYGNLDRMTLVECGPPATTDKTPVILAAVMSLFLTGALILGSKLMMRNFFKVKLFLLKLVMKRPTRKAIAEQSAA